MRAPTIAIVGSVDQSRKELGLTDPATAVKAAEDIGRELAIEGCRLLVYSSDTVFIEPAVVRGYVGSGKALPNSIEVRFPSQSKQPSFAEQTSNAACFEFQPSRSRDWEVSFYHSLRDADGILIIGGGQSTFIAGLVAIGMRLPIVALAGFGGAAAKVWETIPTADGVSQEESAFMAQQFWTQDSAAKCVGAILAQRKRALVAAQKTRAAQSKEKQLAVTRAVIAAALFILCISAWPLSWNYMPLDKDLFLFPLLAAPLIAGASGATVRNILDTIQGNPLAEDQPAIVNTLIGVIAGGMVALLLLLGQLVAVPDSADTKTAALHARGLVPFAVCLGFIGGLTLDAVFRKLRSTDVVRTEPLQPPAEIK